MIVVNENDGQEFVSEFFDAGGNPTAPSTVEWSLQCLTTGAVLQDWTAIPLQTTVEPSGLTTYFVEGVISGPLNAIRNNRNARELKQLQIVSNRNTASQFSDVVNYYVRNIQGR